MIIRGCFIGDAPYFITHLRSKHFRGQVWFMADTGASYTTLLDRNVKLLGIPSEVLEPDPVSIVGVGGSVCSYRVRDIEITMVSEEGDIVLYHDLWVVKHDLEHLPQRESARVLKIPSVLGRDLINQFCFTYDYKNRIVQLER